MMSGEIAGGVPGPQILPETRPYWLRYAGHLVEFGSLPEPIRVMARIAALVALLGLLVLVLPLGRMAAVPLPTMFGERVPEIALYVGTVLQMLGWWYVLSGISTVFAPLRWPVALAFILFQGDGMLGGSLAFALPIILTLAYTILTSFRKLQAGWNMLAAGVIVGLFYLIALRQGVVLFSVLTLDQIGMFYLIFLPVIFYSGFDLGETGLFFTRLGLWHLHPRISARALWWIAALIVLLKLAWFARYWSPPSWNLLVAIGVLAAGAWLTGRLRTHAEPPELVPFLFSVLIFAGLFGMRMAYTLWGWAALLALGAGAVLAVLSGRRRHLAASAVFLLIFGLWNLFSMSYHPGGPLYVPGTTGITAHALDVAITLVAVAYLLWLRLRGELHAERLMLIIFWLVGFTLLLGMWDFLSSLHDLSHGILTAEAILLLIGIAHDVAASGGLLNRGTKGLPRTARVLLYLGYLLLLSGSTVIAAGTTGPISGLAQIDAYQEAGLLIIGMPLFLQQFLHAFSFGHHGHPNDAEEGHSSLHHGPASNAEA